MSPIMKSIDEVIDQYTGMSRKVLEYSQFMKEMVDAGKQPGFSTDQWEPLKALVDAENFERVGNFKEVMDWDEYVGFLTRWAMNSEWDCSFKRITETENRVILELEERSKTADFSNVVNSISVYEFNRDGKICHVDVYLQMEMPGPEIFKSYEGVV